MANECLVTKLKGVVDNPNIPTYGAIEFKVGPGSLNLYLNVPKGSVFVFDNTTDSIHNGSGAGSVITSGWTNPNDIAPAGSSNVRLNGTITVDTKFSIVGARYGIDYLDSGSNSCYTYVDKNFMDSIKFTDYDTFSISRTQSDCIGMYSISDFKSTSLKVFGCGISSSCPFSGSLADFAAFSSIERILVNQTGNAFVGDIEDLYTLSSLVMLQVQRNSDITGTVEELVEKMSLNRTDGTLTMDCRYTKCTFHTLLAENVVSGAFTIIFSDDEVLVKDGSTLLATYDKTNHTWTYNS